MNQKTATLKCKACSFLATVARERDIECSVADVVHQYLPEVKELMEAGKELPKFDRGSKAGSVHIKTDDHATMLKMVAESKINGRQVSMAKIIETIAAIAMQRETIFPATGPWRTDWERAPYGVPLLINIAGLIRVAERTKDGWSVFGDFVRSCNPDHWALINLPRRSS